MANLSETPEWAASVIQIENADAVLGGPDGVVNVQASALASRTAYLKQEVEAAGALADNASEKADQAIAAIADIDAAAGSTSENAAAALLSKQGAEAAQALAAQARDAAQAAQAQSGNNAGFAYQAAGIAQEKAAQTTADATTAFVAAGAAVAAQAQVAVLATTEKAAISALATESKDEIGVLSAESLAEMHTVRDQTLVASGTASSAALEAYGSKVESEVSRQASGVSASSAAASKSLAELARDAAMLSGRTWPTTAAALGNGIAGYASLVAGSGGANGTFALAFAGGTQVLAPVGYFVVAGGSVVQVVITNSGYYSAGTPTLSFAASAGLTGASATAVMAVNVAAGRYFSTPSADSAESLILYLNNAGVAVEQKRYPSVEKLAPLLPIAPAGYAWALVDENGLASVGVLLDGTLRVSRLVADEASATRMKLGTDDAIAATPAGYVWALLDQYGNAALAVRADGMLMLTALQASTFNGVQAKRITDLVGVKPGNYLAEIVQIISYGQSLSLGVAGSAGDLQTTSQEYDSLMFNAGVRAYEGAGTAADKHAALVPLIENYFSSQGETPIGQAAAMIKKLIRDENGILHTEQSYRILGSAAGVSATAISGLGRGSVGYTQLMADVTYGAARAAAMGCSHNVPVIYWSQGEQDYTAGTTYAAYLAAFETLYQHLNADIKAATGQANDIKVIGYQCFQSGFSPATVALAQLQASKNNPNIIIACPNYHIDHVPGNVHLNGAGYGMLGAYYGLAFKRVAVDGLAWKPLSPLSMVRQGAIATIKFHVPVRPLELDTTGFSAQTAGGFSLVDGGGNPIAITAASLIGPDTVKLVAASALTAGCKVRYGFAGGGNLRDSQGYGIFVQQKARRALHNWCVAFEETFV